MIKFLCYIEDLIGSLLGNSKIVVKIISVMEYGIFRLLGRTGERPTIDKEFKFAVSLFDKKIPNLCVDMGGNKGIYTEKIINKFPDCKVVIFEPAKVNVKFLHEKFKHFSNIIIEPLAISNESGSTTLFSNKDGSGIASLTKRNLDHIGIDFENTESIKSIRFEDYWKEKLNSQHIDFCKLDIEGHELDALMGFGDAIKHVSVIQFEFGGCNIDTRTFFKDFWYFFQENEFNLYRMSPLGLIYIPKYRELDECFGTTNYLAKHR